MSKDVELTQVSHFILKYSKINAEKGNSSSVLSSEEQQDLQDTQYYIRKNVYDYFYYQLKFRYKDLFLKETPLHSNTLKSLIEFITSFGDYNALPAMMKVFILCLWAYLKKKLLKNRTVLYHTKVEDVYAIELFYSYIMKNSLAITWPRHAQEFILQSIGRKEELSSGIMQKMQDVLDTLHLLPHQDRDGVLSAVLTPDLANVTYPTLNGWTHLHYLCLVNDNLLQFKDLMKIILSTGSNFHATDYKNQTALHFAALTCNYAAVMNLCSLRGINKAAVDIYGRTPLRVFLETLAVSSRAKFLTVERMTAIIKELLPNENPLTLWELWSINTGINAGSVNSLSRNQCCGMFYIVKYCNVAVCYEILNLSLPVLPSSFQNIQIFLEIFIVVIKMQKNSLFPRLLQHLLQEDASWKKAENRWTIQNLLLSYCIVSLNYDGMIYLIENLSSSCELTSSIVAEIQQSPLKRCQYLSCLYLLAIMTGNDPLQKPAPKVAGNNPTATSTKGLAIDIMIKHFTVILGQHIFLLSQSSLYSSITKEENEKQFLAELDQNFPLVALYRLLVSKNIMVDGSIQWNEWLYFIIDNLNPLFVAGFSGNSLVLESLFKRIYVTKKETPSNNPLSLKAPFSSSSDEDFAISMKRQYIKCITYAMYLLKSKSIESIRGFIGFTTLGELLFCSGFSPKSQLAPFDFWMLLIRWTIQRHVVTDIASIKIKKTQNFVESNFDHVTGLHKTLNHNLTITDDHVQMLKLCLHAFPYKVFTKRLMLDSPVNEMTYLTSEYHLNKWNLAERVQIIDHILYENIGGAYISRYSFSPNSMRPNMNDRGVNDFQKMKVLTDIGQIMKMFVEESEIARKSIDEFYSSMKKWKYLKENMFSSKFKIGIRKLSKNYTPDQAWLKLSFQFMQLQGLLFPSPSSSTSLLEWKASSAITIDIQTWKKFEKYLSSIVYKDDVFIQTCKQLCQYSSFYTDEVLINRNKANADQNSSTVFAHISHDSWLQFLEIFHSHHFNVILKNSQNQDPYENSRVGNYYSQRSEREEREEQKSKFFYDKHDEGKEKLRKSHHSLSYVFGLLRQWMEQIIHDGNVYFEHYVLPTSSTKKQYYDFLSTSQPLTNSSVASPTLILTKYDFYQYYKLFIYRQRLLRVLSLQSQERLVLPYTLLSSLFNRNPEILKEFHILSQEVGQYGETVKSLQFNLFGNSTNPIESKDQSKLQSDNQIDSTGAYQAKSLSYRRQILDASKITDRNFEIILELCIQFHFQNNWNVRALLAYILPLVSLGKYSLAKQIIEKAKQPADIVKIEEPVSFNEKDLLREFIDIPIEAFYYFVSVRFDRRCNYEEDIKNLLKSCRQGMFALPMTDGISAAEKIDREANRMLNLFAVTPLHFALIDGDMSFIQLFLSTFTQNEFIIDFFQLFEFVEITNSYQNWKDFIKILNSSYHHHASSSLSFYNDYYLFDSYYYHHYRESSLDKEEHYSSSSTLRKNPFYRATSRNRDEERSFYDISKLAILEVIFPHSASRTKSTDIASWIRLLSSNSSLLQKEGPLQNQQRRKKLFNYLVETPLLSGSSPLDRIKEGELPNRFASLHSEFSLKSIQAAVRVLPSLQNTGEMEVERMKFITIDGSILTLPDIIQNPINLLRCFPLSREIIGFGRQTENSIFPLCQKRLLFNYHKEFLQSLLTCSNPLPLLLRMNLHGLTPLFSLLLRGEHELVYKCVQESLRQHQTSGYTMSLWDQLVKNTSASASLPKSEIGEIEDKPHQYWYDLNMYTNHILRQQYQKLQAQYTYDFLPQLLSKVPLPVNPANSKSYHYPYITLFDVIGNKNRTLQSGLFIPQIAPNVASSSTTFPERERARKDNYLLQFSIILQYCKYLWKMILYHHNFLRFLQFSSSHPYSKLDSFIRARQILTMLNIPYSYLMATQPSELTEQLFSSSTLSPVRSGGEGNEVGSPTLSNPLTSAPNTRNSVNLAGMTNKEQIRKLESQFSFDPFTFSLRVHHSLFLQLKYLVAGFYQLRNNDLEPAHDGRISISQPVSFHENTEVEKGGMEEDKENHQLDGNGDVDSAKRKSTRKDKNKKLFQGQKSLVDSLLLFHSPWISAILLGKSDLTIEDYLHALNHPSNDETAQTRRNQYVTKPSVEEIYTALFGPAQQQQPDIRVPTTNSSKSNPFSFPCHILPTMEDNSINKQRDLLKLLQVELSSINPHDSMNAEVTSTSSNVREADRLKAGILSSFANVFSGGRSYNAPVSLTKPSIMSDPRALMEALQSAYLIIEFARCLCLCRLFSILTLDITPALDLLQQQQKQEAALSSMTEEKETAKYTGPLPSSKPVPPPFSYSAQRFTNSKNVEAGEINTVATPSLTRPVSMQQISKENLLLLTETNLRYQYHPYTFYEKKLLHLRFQLFIINDIVKVIPQSQSSVALKIGGLKERIRFCDYFTVQEFKNFFKFPSYYSVRFNILKEIVSNGLAALFMDLGKSNYCELICRLTLQSASTQSNNSAAAVLPFPVDLMEKIDSGVAINTNRKGEEDKNAVNSGGSKLDSEKLEHFQEIVKLLQSFTLQDFWFPAIQLQQSENQSAGNKYSAFLTRFSAFSGSEPHRDGTFSSAGSKDSHQVSHPMLHALREGSLVSITFEEEVKIISLLSKAPVSAGSIGRSEQIIHETIQSLNSCFRIGSLLYWLLTSIYGLLTQSKLALTSTDSKNPEELVSTSISSLAQRTSHFYDNDLSFCQNFQHKRFPPLIALCLSRVIKDKNVWHLRKRKLLSSTPKGQKQNLNLFAPPLIESHEKEIAQLLLAPDKAHFVAPLWCYELDYYQRSPIEIAAISGNFDLLKLFLDSLQTLPSNKNREEEHISLTQVIKMPHYKYLLWHLLMACPAFSKYQPEYRNDSLSSHITVGFYKCVELLLSTGFSYDSPIATSPMSSLGSTSPKVGLNCLDLMILKRFPVPLLIMYIKRYEDDFHNRSINTQERVNHRFASHWLSLSLLSMIHNCLFFEEDERNYYSNCLPFRSSPSPTDSFSFNIPVENKEEQRNLYLTLFQKLMSWTLQSHGVVSGSNPVGSSENSFPLFPPKAFSTFSLADLFVNTQFFDQVIVYHSNYVAKVTYVPVIYGYHGGEKDHDTTLHYARDAMNQLCKSFQYFLYPYQVIYQGRNLFLHHYCPSLNSASKSYRTHMSEVGKTKFKSNSNREENEPRVEKSSSLFCPVQRDMQYVIALFEQLIKLPSLSQMKETILHNIKEIETMRKVIIHHHQTIFPSMSSLQFNQPNQRTVSNYLDEYRFTLLEIAIISNDELAFEFLFPKVVPFHLHEQYLDSGGESKLISRSRSSDTEYSNKLIFINYLQQLILLMMEYRADSIFQLFSKLLLTFFLQRNEETVKPVNEENFNEDLQQEKAIEKNDDKALAYHQLMHLITNNTIFYQHSLIYQVLNYKYHISELKPALNLFNPTAVNNDTNRPLSLSSSASTLTIVHYLLFQRPLPQVYLPLFYYTSWTVEFIRNLLFSYYFSEDSLLIVFDFLSNARRQSNGMGNSVNTTNYNALFEEICSTRFEHGQSICHVFCRYGYAKLIKLWIDDELGLELFEVPDEDGNLPVHYSIGAGHKEITKMLRKYCPKEIEIALENLTYFCRLVLLSRFTTVYQQKKKLFLKNRKEQQLQALYEATDEQDYY